MSENLKKISFRISPQRYGLIKEDLTFQFSYQTKASTFIRTAIDLLLFFDGEILFEEIDDEDLKRRIKYEKTKFPGMVASLERERMEKEDLIERIVNEHEVSKEILRQIINMLTQMQEVTKTNIKTFETVIPKIEDGTSKKECLVELNRLKEMDEKYSLIVKDIVYKEQRLLP